MARRTVSRSLKTPAPQGPITQCVALRSYQQPVVEAMLSGLYRRAVTVWHRGAGKDFTWLWILFHAMTQRPGQYFHVFPTYAQGKKAIWKGYITLEGRTLSFLDIFPEAAIENKLDTEMVIKFKPMNGQAVGSLYQVVGADNPDALRGTAPVGVVFSEYPWMDARIWQEIVEPRLTQNRGWAGFAFTPRGRDHAFQLWEAAKQSTSWFTHLATIADTRCDAEGESGEPVIPESAIAEKRQMGQAEEILQQEYYCSFEGFTHGTIYGDLLRRARDEGRIGRVPWVSSLPVGTMWDIGRRDATAIWFYQQVGSEIRVIDYYANHRQGADHYAKVLRDKPYLYGRLVLPHDARVTGYAARESTEEYLARVFPHVEVQVAEKIGLQAGIDIVRRFFSRFYFDEVKCGTPPNPGLPAGLESLWQYRRDWDVERGEFSGEPVHDQHSHGADALRTGLVGWQDGLSFLHGPEREITVETAFSLDTLGSVPAVLH